MELSTSESGKIGKKVHILQSFGATYEICGFLEPLDILKLQQLSRWLYNRGIARVQTYWRLRKRYYFTYGQSAGLKSTVFVYDAVTGEAKTIKKKKIFDFHNKQTIQVSSHLYSVAWQQLQVTRYSGQSLAKKKELASGNEFRQNFSLAAHLATQ